MKLIILFILILLIIAVLVFAYSYLEVQMSNIADPTKFQQFVHQIPNLVNNPDGTFLQQLEQAGIAYGTYLIENGKITPQELLSLGNSLNSARENFIKMMLDGKINWNVFLQDYYYKNNPSLQS